MTKIMVVDDEPDLAEMLQLMLHKEGFETNTANSGLEFLQKIDIFQPDLVILDVMMPGLTTGEILEKFKGKKGNPEIILLTVVRYSDEEKKKLLQMGNVVDYVTKPFDLKEVLDIIHRHVMNH